LDETLALPTEERSAWRSDQQIIAHETGVADVIDPFGGSYFVESLTDQLEREAEGLFAESSRWVAWSRNRKRLVPTADRALRRAVQRDVEAAAASWSA